MLRYRVWACVFPLNLYNEASVLSPRRALTFLCPVRHSTTPSCLCLWETWAILWTYNFVGYCVLDTCLFNLIHAKYTFEHLWFIERKEVKAFPRKYDAVVLEENDNKNTAGQADMGSARCDTLKKKRERVRGIELTGNKERTNQMVPINCSPSPSPPEHVLIARYFLPRFTIIRIRIEVWGRSWYDYVPFDAL